jgi:hypothetical protein
VVTTISEKLAATFFKTKVEDGGSRFLQNATSHETAWSYNLEYHNLRQSLPAPPLSLIYYVYHTNL